MGSVTNNTLSVFPVLCQDWRFIHMWKTGGRCGVWSARKTSLSPPILFQDRNVSGTPPLCIGVSVSIQERERSCINVLEVLFYFILIPTTCKKKIYITVSTVSEL
jgi:hypothetical protein